MTSSELMKIENRVIESYVDAVIAMRKFCDTLKPSEKQEQRTAWEKR